LPEAKNPARLADVKESIKCLEKRLTEIEKEYADEPFLLALYRPGVELLLNKYKETLTDPKEENESP